VPGVGCARSQIMKAGMIQKQVDLIREVFTYTHRFTGKTFVFHIDYKVIDTPLFPPLVKDLVLLHRAGIHVVLVPGARQRIDEVLTQYGLSWERIRGVRIATPEAMPFIKMAAFDVANRLLTTLSVHRTNAVLGNWVRARAVGVEGGVDFQHAGHVERVQLDLLRTVLEDGLVPIFPCIGWSGSGQPYNISSRELATSISMSLAADKLFFITSTPGIDAGDYQLPAGVDTGRTGRISRMDVAQAKAFLHTNRPSDGDTDYTDYELVAFAHKAAAQSVNRVHIIDGTVEGAVLMEIFSTLGVGTMVHANEYQSIRPMRPEDSADVHRLMLPLSQRGVLVKRSEDELARRYEDFVVHETDGTIHGCGALHRYPDGSGEIAGIAVDRAFEHLGIGQKIVSYLIDRGRSLGIPRLFVLTTQTSDWFEQLGFKKSPVDRLPEEKRALYDPERNSRVLVLDL
ncbi:MAG: amino-acid N-acetyltransferase, partial [Alkalispirochaetaceae bacterium]